MPYLVDVYDAVPDLYCFDEFNGAPRTSKKTFLWGVRTMIQIFKDVLVHIFHAGSA